MIKFCTENDDTLLIFNHKSFIKLSDWLDETLSLIDYAKHKDFLKKIDGSILHLNLPFDDNHQTADLLFHATHAIVLRQLSVLFDVDYYIYQPTNPSKTAKVNHHHDNFQNRLGDCF